ncbi:MAG TPA: hypothetical protein EYP59_13235 [Thiotrichaceae bacterium]|nr:hypothetical protein [Thiotrichaceae bacterium]
MKLSKLTLATAGILIIGISLTACSGTIQNPSGPSPIATSDCPILTGAEQDGQEKATVVAQKTPRSTSNPEPHQEYAGCTTLQELEK